MLFTKVFQVRTSMSSTKKKLGLWLLLVLGFTGVAACSPADVRGAEKEGSFTASVDWLPNVDAPEVGVRSPAGHFFFAKQTNIECSGFRVLSKKLIVDLDDAHGIRWIEGKSVIERLFVEPGDYELVVADNLEGDLDSVYSSIFSVKIERNAELMRRRAKSVKGTCVSED